MIRHKKKNWVGPPLAWLNLVYAKNRLIVAISAICFTVALIFIQLGLFSAVLKSATLIYDNLNFDIIFISSKSLEATFTQPFYRQRLYQAQGIKGVVSTVPFYTSFLAWRNPETNLTRQILVLSFNLRDQALKIPEVYEHITELRLGIWKNFQNLKNRSIRVFAFNPADVVFMIPDVQNSAGALQLPNTLLADKKSFQVYGCMKQGVIAELSNRRIEVIGTFELGADYVSEGNLIMSDQNFLRIFAKRPSGFTMKIRSSLDNIDLGLIKVEKGTNISSLIETLNKSLPKDIKVFDKKDFIQRELEHWDRTTSVGFVFGIGKTIGFIVGMIIVYNIIYTDISHNLPQYATLKAMGYSTLYIQTIIFIESIIISVLGFFPGFFVSMLMYKIIANTTGLLMEMNLNSVMLVLILTIIMCLSASLIAAKRLHNIDPAELYNQKF